LETILDAKVHHSSSPFPNAYPRPERNQHHLRHDQGSSGAPIPTAKLKVVNQDTGFEAQTTSNESGIYRVGSLLPGTYRVEVESDGFERLVRPSLVLQVGQILTVDLALVVGKQSEVVTVTEAGR